ncbi:MAG: MBOAT family O-acyltransferase [Pirellulaceae bacterium]
MYSNLAVLVDAAAGSVRVPEADGDTSNPSGESAERGFDLSQSITEFWRRWHLSLSTWLRDNLYYPPGGNCQGPVRTYINLALVMLLGGLWHGASWNFVIWGAIHGLMLILERLAGKHAFYERLPGFAKTAITFVIVCFTWVFIAAATIERQQGGGFEREHGQGGHQCVGQGKGSTRASMIGNAFDARANELKQPIGGQMLTASHRNFVGSGTRDHGDSFRPRHRVTSLMGPP